MSDQSVSSPVREAANLPAPVLFHDHIPAPVRERIITRAITLAVDGYRVRLAKGAANYAVFKPGNEATSYEAADYFVNTAFVGCSCGGSRKYGDCKHRLYIAFTVATHLESRRAARLAPAPAPTPAAPAPVPQAAQPAATPAQPARKARSKAA